MKPENISYDGMANESLFISRLKWANKKTFTHHGYGFY